MDLTKVALDNRLFEMKVGSHLYGTSTPESDVDFCGVFVAPKEFYLGLSKVEEVDLSIVSKRENGRNDKDAVDRKFYELRKFVSLAMMNNPNITEMLFVNPEHAIFMNDMGRHLIENRHLFPYKGCFDRFMGYAVSQKKKMVVKRDNMLDIIDAIEFLDTVQEPSRVYVVELSHEIQHHNVRFKNTGTHFNIGDMSIQKNDTVKQALRKLNDRREKFSSRFDDYVSKTGYDTKFASHLIRLLIEGKELLETGELLFPLKEAQMILDIKNGKYTIEEIMEMSNWFENEMRYIMEKSDLPEKPNKNKIEKMLIQMVEESWK